MQVNLLRVQLNIYCRVPALGGEYMQIFSIKDRRFSEIFQRGMRNAHN